MTPFEVVIWALALVIVIALALVGLMVVVALLRATYELARYGEIKGGKK